MRFYLSCHFIRKECNNFQVFIIIFMIQYLWKQYSFPKYLHFTFIAHTILQIIKFPRSKELNVTIAKDYNRRLKKDEKKEKRKEKRFRYHEYTEHCISSRNAHTGFTKGAEKREENEKGMKWKGSNSVVGSSFSTIYLVASHRARKYKKPRKVLHFVLNS